MASSNTVQLAVECPVCLVKFSLPERVPKILGCGHTFCTCCLRKLTTADYNVNCPTCRTAHIIPDGRIEVPCNDGTDCTSSMEGETVPDTFKCTAYHNCTDSQWLYMNCTAGMYYSPLSGSCVENVSVCGDNVCIVNDIVTSEIL